MGLEGKVALVTGASRGIGRAIALELAAKGADVVVNFAGDEKAADEVVQAIEGMGRKALKVRCNVGDMEQVTAMVQQALDAFGRIDILVNNAGIARDNLVMRMKESEFDDVIQINLKGVFNTIKACSRPMLKQRGGRIVNISSVVGVAGNMGQANYAAAKAGVIGLTKSLAKELASKGITVNAVAPGFIETDMTDAMSEDTRSHMMTEIPLGRCGQASEVGNVVRFLASDDASYITGQVILVDGGMHI